METIINKDNITKISLVEPNLKAHAKFNSDENKWFIDLPSVSEDKKWIENTYNYIVIGERLYYKPEVIISSTDGKDFFIQFDSITEARDFIKSKFYEEKFLYL